MSALLSSTEAEAPVRFGRTRVVLAVLVVVGTLASLVANCARTLTNTDTYFHLRFGQEFLDGWSLRHPGSVSTFATRDWVPTQWLSEIVMARTEDWFGLAGVAWLSGFLEIALFVTLYVVCRDRAEPLVAAALTATALFAMQNGLSMRPQVISYLLVAVVVGAWLRTARDGRVRWWLVPLVWVWAMLHGMWPVALVIGAAAVVGLALDRAPRRLLVRAAAVPVASAVVAALTPVGPELYTAVAAVGSRSQYFAEWGSPDWTSWEYGALALLLVLTGLAMWRRRHNPWTEIVLVALAVAFAVYSRADRAGRGRDDRAAARRAAAGPPGPSYAGRPARAARGGRRCPRRARGPRGGGPVHVGGSACGARLDGRRPGRPAAGHQGPRRLGPGRLRDVALPAARPDDARLRRHLHHRRAPAQHRADRPRPGLGGVAARRPGRASPCSDPGRGWRSSSAPRGGGPCRSPTTTCCSGPPPRGSRTAPRSRRGSAQPAEASTQRASTSAAAPLSTASAARVSAGGAPRRRAPTGRRRRRAQRLR